MTLPSVIQIKVDCPEGGDLSGLIFQMRVTAGTKNQYYISFPKTTAAGETSISAEDFCGQFADHHEMGLMDYNGTVEMAGNLVGIDLFDSRPMMKLRKQLSHGPLPRHQQTMWRSRQERMDYFLSSRNSEFYFFKGSVFIPEDGLIHLTVGRKIKGRVVS
jgi:hypothetical protein